MRWQQYYHGSDSTCSGTTNGTQSADLKLVELTGCIYSGSEYGNQITQWRDNLINMTQYEFDNCTGNVNYTSESPAGCYNNNAYFYNVFDFDFEINKTIPVSTTTTSNPTTTSGQTTTKAATTTDVETTVGETAAGGQNTTVDDVSDDDTTTTGMGDSGMTTSAATRQTRNFCIFLVFMLWSMFFV